MVVPLEQHGSFDGVGGRGSAWAPALWSLIVERSGAVILIMFSLPVVLVASVWIVALSRRTPFVAHHRIGQFGQPFWMWKLRTMWAPNQSPQFDSFVERIQNGHVHWRKDLPDPRITSRFAGFCRKFSVDELPQLWHVATGRMALVGPRPLTAVEIVEHYGQDAGRLLQAKPGITGLWQVRGRNRLTYRQRRRLDLFFVRHDSPELRTAILLRSIAVVFGGRGAS